jgi:V-type H+-transporting ATPase subunit A
LGNVFIPRGIEVPCLDQEKEWHFRPNRNLKKGDPVTGGDVIGNVYENALFPDHCIMAHPKARGKVVELFDEANYTVSSPICVIEDVNGK